MMNDKLETNGDNTHDEEEDNGDNRFNSQNGFVAFNKDCCVRVVLVTVVVVTAVIVVVIVATNRKSDDVMTMTVTTTESVYWQQSTVGKRLAFEHQFLLRDLSDQRTLLIMAVDDARRMYVIVWHNINKHFNLYLAADFAKRTETILVVSKSENSHGTDIEENAVLLCVTKRFDRGFQGSFAKVFDVTTFQNSGSDIKSSETKTAYAINYIGVPLTLERFISTVVNSSCDDLPRAAVFQWNKPDESLACGENVHSETRLESCSRDLCQIFPGNPQSRGQICQNFRHCNYVQKSCDPYYRHNPSRIDHHPYCVCRKTAAENAEAITCPRIADDGGECELPRRDLLVSQMNLPCLCLYRFYVVYPFTLKHERSINVQHDSSAKVTNNDVHWNVKEVSVTGPALTFSQCSC